MDDVYYQTYRGERLPGIEEQWTLAKHVRRIVKRDLNKKRREDEPYDSDDDFGESFPDVEQEVANELQAAKDAAEAEEKENAGE